MFLDKLKNKILRAMLSNLLKGILAKFKSKNPAVWIVIAALLTSAQIVLNQLVAAGTIPETAGWVEWVMWVIALLLGSGEVAAYQYKDKLAPTDARPEKMVHLSDSQKIKRLEERNEVLEELMRRA